MPFLNAILCWQWQGWGSCLPPSPREQQHRAIAPELNWGTLPCPICPGSSSSAPWLCCWEQLPAPGPGELLKQLVSGGTNSSGWHTMLLRSWLPGDRSQLFAEQRLSCFPSPNLQAMLSSSSWQPHQQENNQARLKWDTESQKHNTHYCRMRFPPYFLIFTLTRASSLIITGRDLLVVTSSAEAGQENRWFLQMR